MAVTVTPARTLLIPASIPDRIAALDVTTRAFQAAAGNEHADADRVKRVVKGEPAASGALLKLMLHQAEWLNTALSVYAISEAPAPAPKRRARRSPQSSKQPD